MVGRSDSLLNIRDIKIAPEEFEQNLLKVVPLQDVCVLTLPDQDKVEHVVIAVTQNEGEDRSNIIKRIQKLISPFLGVTRVASVSEMPRTGTGKIERALLRQALLKHAQES